MLARELFPSAVVFGPDQFFRELRALRARKPVRDDDPRTILFTTFCDEDAMRPGLLMNNGGEFAQQKFARSDRFGQAQR